MLSNAIKETVEELLETALDIVDTDPDRANRYIETASALLKRNTPPQKG